MRKVPFICADYEVAHYFASANKPVRHCPDAATWLSRPGLSSAGERTMATTVAVIVAAGRGRAGRSGRTSIPKQYLPPGRRAGARPFPPRSGRHPQIDRTRSSSPDDRPNSTRRRRGRLPHRLDDPVPGGATRQESVRAGLEALGSARSRTRADPRCRPPVPDRRPGRARLLAALDDDAGAIAAEPVADTLKRAAADGTIAQTVDRAGLWRAQTPQAFRFAAILAAHRRRRHGGPAATSPTMPGSPSGPASPSSSSPAPAAT